MFEEYGLEEKNAIKWKANLSKIKESFDFNMVVLDSLNKRISTLEKE